MQMNVALLPTTSPQDTAGVNALLAFLADKDACAARLTELTAEKVAAEQTLVDAHRANTEARELMEQARQIHDGLLKREVELSDREDSATRRHSDLDTRKNSLDERELELKAAADAVAAREIAVEMTQRAAHSLHETASAHLADAEKSKAEWQSMRDKAAALLKGD